MTPGAEIEPGPHWWKASALTTRPTLPPSKQVSQIDYMLESQIDYMLESFCVGEMFGHHTYIHTVPPETMGPFAEILPWSNRGFDLQFHLGKTV